MPRPAETLTTPAQIAEALDEAMSQLNSCSVALSNLGIGGDLTDPDSPATKLLSAFCDAMAARDATRTSIPA